MNKNRKMLNKLRSLEGIYVVFLYSAIPPIIIGIWCWLNKATELNYIVNIMMVCAYFISLMLFIPHLKDCIKSYYFEKRVYKYGTELKILNVSFSVNDLIKPCSNALDIVAYMYSFKIIYIDLDGMQKEMYSEPCGISELNYVLNFFSTQDEINQTLNALQFELKEYKGQKQVYISTTKENIMKFKSTRNKYENQRENLIKVEQICENDAINNYIIENLNILFEGSNVKISLNQNLHIEDKAKHEMITGYNYNLKETYPLEFIINSLRNDEYGESQISNLAGSMAIDIKEDCEVAIYVSNYSERFKTDVLTFKVYYKID